MTESDYLDTTQFTEKYNDIDLTSKKNSTKSDNKEVLTKDELMLKYLLENLKKENEQNQTNNTLIESKRNLL